MPHGPLAVIPSEPMRARSLRRLGSLGSCLFVSALLISAGAWADWPPVTAESVAYVTEAVRQERDKALRRLSERERRAIVPAPNPIGGPPRPGELTLYNFNTGETLTLRPFDETDRIPVTAQSSIDWIFRCFRERNATQPIDSTLVRLLYEASHRFGAPIVLVSGFRTPAFSRRRNSYHVRGKAADVRIPGVSTDLLRDYFESLANERFGSLGVGYYPTSQFIHVDTREVSYFWTDRSGPRRSRRRVAAR